MTAIERSPLGDEREREVACQLCHKRWTANFSAICTPCRKRDWSPLAAALDALAAISEPKGTR